MAAPRAFLCLGAREWNGRGRVIHSTSESVTPNSTQKRKTLLQFLSDHFHDIQALREYWLQKQILKVNQNNRFFTNIQKKYGPYIRDAFFILNQGGAVKYGSCHGVMWEGGASLRLKELVPGLQFVIYKVRWYTEKKK